MKRAAFTVLAVLAAGALADPGADAAPPRRSLEDYRHFRAASIDLLGRMPNRAELAELEKPDFTLDAWIDRHLGDPTYAARMTRIYMDVLRLEPNLTFGVMPWQLYRHEIQGPDGPVHVYWRENQRRTREETDAEFCLTSDETGLLIRPRVPTLGTPKKVTKEALERATVLVKPWWLYRDYKSPGAHERYGDGWANADPRYQPSDTLLKDPDGKPTAQIRICREEAQAAETGHIYASGRKKPPPGPKPEKLKPGELPPGGRYRPPPLDRPYAVQHKGESVTCATRLALDNSVDCGCGPALERCLPSDGAGQGSAGFFFPNHQPLGPALPLDNARQPAQRWFPYWWSQEAVRFMEDIFARDADFREILTGKSTSVNGPLAQYYRSVQRTNCCGPELTFGMTEEGEPLIEPGRIPADLLAHDVSTWKPVPDRGPHAAGILTMPIFLEKFATSRARGAVLYSAFLCKSFVSDQVKLEPSTEPNLMVRPGCSTCHATLEPLAAYFARIEPSSFVFLPQAQFPLKNPACKKNAAGKLSGPCNSLYDVAFADDAGATLQSAYGSFPHAEAGAAGAGHDIAAAPEFASCAVERVTSALLGRATTPEDAPLLEALTAQLKASGYKMKTVVRGVMRSEVYRSATDIVPGTPPGGRP